MQIIKKVLRQKAIYWQNTGTDHHGQNTFAAPVEIRVRWDDQIGEFTGPRGETLATRASVMVDRDVKPGDQLKLGVLESGTPESPIDVEDAFPIQAFQKIPTIKGTKFLRVAHL